MYKSDEAFWLTIDQIFNDKSAALNYFGWFHIHLALLVCPITNLTPAMVIAILNQIHLPRKFGNGKIHSTLDDDWAKNLGIF